MFRDKNQVTVLRNIFLQGEAKRKTAFNFVSLKFINDQLDCNIISLDDITLQKMLEDLNIASDDLNLDFYQSFCETIEDLISRDLKKCTILMIEVGKARNLKVCSNLDETTFVNNVYESLEEYENFSI